MEKQPILETERLILRPFSLSDAPRVRLLAGDERIADVTLNIPHPYPEGLAEDWIAGHSERWKRGELATYAILVKEDNRFIGCVSAMNIEGAGAEIGYWIGVEFWGNGYATEACKRLIGFCFDGLMLERVNAQHLSRNPASGRVLMKSGLSHTDSGETRCGYRGLKESVKYYELINTKAQ